MREKALPTNSRLVSSRARILIQDSGTCPALSSLQSRTFHRILPGAQGQEEAEGQGHPDF